jgi:hypothetical protein
VFFQMTSDSRNKFRAPFPKVASSAKIWDIGGMSMAEIVKELEALPRPERANVAKQVLQSLCPDNKVVERVMRRIENPDIPEDVWRGIEDAEDGRLVEMEAALRDKPRNRSGG